MPRSLYEVSMVPVRAGRDSFVYVVAHIVSWLALSPSPASFRKSAYDSVTRSVDTILRIQAWRVDRPWLTPLFQCWTFCAEEDFYLLLLPLMFWNVHTDLARQLTYVVVFGVASGNVLKDIFQLPRPRKSGHPNASKIQIPAGGAALDSSGLQDFGFPSTHSLNAVTNPCFVLLFLFSSGYLSLTSRPVLSALALVLAVAHMIGLPLSRLFLGVHSVTDVTGGLILGSLVMVVANSFMGKFDDWLLHDNYALLIFTAVLVAIIFMCPQPRPRTPTFLQTAMMLALACGNAIGSRMYHNHVLMADRAGSPSASTSPLSPRANLFGLPLHPVVGAVVRTVVGFALLWVVEKLAKSILPVLANWVLGEDVRKPYVDPVPASEDARPRTAVEATTPRKKDVVWWPPVCEDPIKVANPSHPIPLSRRITAECAVKTIKYTAIAVAITHTAPAMLNAIGLWTM